MRAKNHKSGRATVVGKGTALGRNMVWETPFIDIELDSEPGLIYRWQSDEAIYYSASGNEIMVGDRVDVYAFARDNQRLYRVAMTQLIGPEFLRKDEARIADLEEEACNHGEWTRSGSPFQALMSARTNAEDTIHEQGEGDFAALYFASLEGVLACGDEITDETKAWFRARGIRW